jgi:hypothetical protein
MVHNVCALAGTVDLVGMLVLKASTVNKEFAVRPSFLVQGSLVCFGFRLTNKLLIFISFCDNV